jgi:hypothetical protein
MVMDESKDEGKDFYQPLAENGGSNELPEVATEDISWSASEFIHHDKSMSWYGVAVLVIIISTVGGYLLMKDVITPIAIITLGAIMLVVGSRKPKTFNYRVSMKGLLIGEKEYSYDEFQSFSIIEEGPIESIMLIPQKRWAPALNIYFAPDDGQKIFDTLSAFLPFEQREKDMVDKFLHKIRF